MPMIEMPDTGKEAWIRRSQQKGFPKLELQKESITNKNFDSGKTRCRFTPHPKTAPKFVAPNEPNAEKFAARVFTRANAILIRRDLNARGKRPPRRKARGCKVAKRLYSPRVKRDLNASFATHDE
ncbi:hypothetical protein L596_016098 [Steinernema carpocapsae]|uniref:Uncharacterized protein n=1 Tax=Steinernema carpocapsae TaxID=34508 RepID=A0A4U5NI69_STECR|nr:hypothetical protein L596_016098 [Steinernema carpocapsae]